MSERVCVYMHEPVYVYLHTEYMCIGGQYLASENRFSIGAQLGYCVAVEAS